MRIVTIVGARPQFIKAAVISRAIRQHNINSDEQLEELIVHTGQHYDPNMSDIFFEEMDIPKPAYNLEINGGSHGKMTGEMLAAIETVLLDEKPDWVLIYGDTNSTLAGALAAAKLHIPVAHVEAGLRSFNRKMPEEVNRVMVDHISSLLLPPTQTAVDNLLNEGISKNVVNVGDVMYDASLYYRGKGEETSTIINDLNLEKGNFVLSTCHRAENTDDLVRLKGILEGLAEIATETPVILPLHPRTKAVILDRGLVSVLGNVRIIEPISFMDMIQLEQNAKAIVTDSGGVQKEAYFFKVPCITMRDETEWVETVEAGWNIIVGADKNTIVTAFKGINPNKPWSEMYGNGDSGGKIVKLLLG